MDDFYGKYKIETETTYIKSSHVGTLPRIFEMWRCPWPSWEYVRVWCKMVLYKVWFQYIRGEPVWVFGGRSVGFILRAKPPNDTEKTPE